MNSNSKTLILYMEDDEDDVDLLKEILQDFNNNIELVHAVNGQQGISVLETMVEENKHPCLVFIDINMPVMNGREVVSWMHGKNFLDKIPVAFLTTSSNPRDTEFAAEHSVDFIIKPNNYIDFKSKIEVLIKRVCA